MEIKLQSFFAEVRDNKLLNIFSNKKGNKLESNYENILKINLI